MHYIDLPEVQKLVPTDEEDDENERLLLMLKDLESVTKELQANNIDFGNAQILFDSVLRNNPSILPRLGPRSKVIENAAFKSALCNVQNRQEQQLTASGPKSLPHLLLSSASTCNEVPDIDKLSSAARLLKQRRLRSNTASMRYMDLRFILPTSYMRWRFFSVVKFAMDPRRAGSLPANIECQLFLNINASLWNVDDVRAMLQ